MELCTRSPDWSGVGRVKDLNPGTCPIKSVYSSRDTQRSVNVEYHHSSRQGQPLRVLCKR